MKKLQFHCEPSHSTKSRTGNRTLHLWMFYVLNFIVNRFFIYFCLNLLQSSYFHNVSQFSWHKIHDLRTWDQNEGPLLMNITFLFLINESLWWLFPLFVITESESQSTDWRFKSSLCIYSIWRTRSTSRDWYRSRSGIAAVRLLHKEKWRNNSVRNAAIGLHITVSSVYLHIQ